MPFRPFSGQARPRDPLQRVRLDKWCRGHRKLTPETNHKALSWPFPGPPQKFKNGGMTAGKEIFGWQPCERPPNIPLTSGRLAPPTNSPIGGAAAHRRCALVALLCAIGVVWAGPGPPVGRLEPPRRERGTRGAGTPESSHAGASLLSRTAPSSYDYNHENLFLWRPEIIDVGSPDVPGAPETTPKGGTRSAPPFGVVSGAPGPVRTPPKDQ